MRNRRQSFVLPTNNQKRFRSRRGRGRAQEGKHFSKLHALLTGLLSPVLVVGMTLAGFAAPAQAAEQATITINNGGVRTGTTGITALAGATFSAYAGTRGSAPSGTAAGSCTTDASGNCSIKVNPLTGGSGNNTNGYWVVQTAAPSDWGLVGSLGTGNYNNSKTVTPYRYFTNNLSSGASISVPSSSALTPQSSPGGNVAKWANVKDNGTFPQLCGVSIAMVFDTSASMSSSDMTSLKNAAKAFVGTSGLGTTPSEVSMFKFDTNATKMTSSPISLVDSAGIASAVSQINSLPNQGTSSGYTNWDAALHLVAQQGNAYDIVLFMTDGDPTRDGAGNQNTNIQVSLIENAIFSANEVKSNKGPSGARTMVLPVGVGLSTNSDLNLKAISGPTVNHDYFLVSNFSALETKLKEIATASCAGTLTVHKVLEDAQGNELDSSPAGWSITAAGNGIVDGSDTKVTPDNTGAVNFPVSFGSDLSARTITVTEAQQTGFVLQPKNGKNAVCTGGTVGDDVTNGFKVSVAPNAVVSCTIVNRQIPTYTVTVNKTWTNSVNGDTTAITLNGDTKTSTAPNNGTVVSGSFAVGTNISVAEQLGSSNNGAYASSLLCVDPNGTELSGSSGGTFTMPSKDVTCTFTNANASHKVSLKKEWKNSFANDAVDLYINDAAKKTSTATGVDHVDNTNVATADAFVGKTVSLKETAHTGNTGAYSASLVCLGDGSQPVQVVNGGIVMPNYDVTCTFTNTARTGTLTLVKEVKNLWGGTATSDAWTLNATSSVAIVSGSYTQGGANTGISAIKVPVGTYTLAETGGAIGYALSGLACTVGPDKTAIAGVSLSNPKVTISEKQDVTCTFTNSDIAPTLQLKKVVAGAQGVSNTNWVLSGTGTGTPVVTNMDGGNTAVVNVMAGKAYQLGEVVKTTFDGGDEFTAGNWVCVDATKQPLSLTNDTAGSGNAVLAGLTVGQQVTCTITNTRQNPGIGITKKVVDTTQNSDGTWSIDYQIKVNNKSKILPTTYDLSDTLHFGAGNTVNAASWSGPGTASGSWSLPAATAQLATGAALAANATATYNVTVKATVAEAAWNNQQTQCVDGGASNGGFGNSATASTPGQPAVTASDCDTPATLGFSKTLAGAPTSNGDGTWDVSYTLTVINASAKAQWYTLEDTPGFASGVTIVGSPVISGAATELPTVPVSIAAKSGDAPTTVSYTVTYTVNLAGATPNTPLQCGEEPASGNGLFNSAVLNTGTIDISDDACANIPSTTFSHEKQVIAGSLTQAADGSWSVQYRVTVNNDGENDGLYSLNDTLKFGTGATVSSASWSLDGTATTGAFSGGSATLATDRPLAAHGSESYTVTVTGIQVPAGWVGDAAGICPTEDPTGSNGGFNNVAGLSYLGGTSLDADCVTPTNPTIAKHFVSAVPDLDNPGHWAVSYTVKVDNTGGGNANYVTLTDKPEFAAGVTINSVTVDGSAASLSGGIVAITSAPVLVAKGATLEYTLTFDVTVGTVATGNAQCSEAGAGSGFFNSATLLVGSDSLNASDCGPIANKVNPDVAKNVVSTTQNADGSWSVVYDVKVTQPAKGDTNPQGLSASYDLSDTLDFGEGITITDATWKKNGAAINTWNVDFDEQQVLASGAVIKAGTTDTYRVTVRANVTPAAQDEGSLVCQPGGDGAGGFLNTARLSVEGNTTDASACAEPAVPEIAKSLYEVIDNGDGTWDLQYEVTVTNPSEDTAAQFVLTDDPATLPDGVSAIGDWAAEAADAATPAPLTASWEDGQSATLAQGELAAGASYHYLVSVSLAVTTTESGDTPETGYCGEGSGIVVWNNATLTSGQLGDEASACGTVQYYDIGIVKTHAPIEGDAVDSGQSDTIDYTLTVTNNSTSDVDGVTVTDPMPTGLTIDLGSLQNPAQWDFSASTETELAANYVGNGGWLAPGESVTIEFTANVGELARDGASSPYSDLENTACVTFTGEGGYYDGNSANDCSTDTTPVKSVTVILNSVCVANAAYLGYTVTPYNVAPGATVAIIWWTADGYELRDPAIAAADEAALLADGAIAVRYVTLPADWSNGEPISGEQLWPGAAVDADGQGIAWPGWRLLPTGQWVLDPASQFYGLRDGAVVEVRINPTVTSGISYPGDDCVPPEPDEGVGGIAYTGSDLGGPLGLGAGLFGLGILVLLGMAWYGRRRGNHGQEA